MQSKRQVLSKISKSIWLLMLVFWQFVSDPKVFLSWAGTDGMRGNQISLSLEYVGIFEFLPGREGGDHFSRTHWINSQPWLRFFIDSEDKSSSRDGDPSSRIENHDPWIRLVIGKMRETTNRRTDNRQRRVLNTAVEQLERTWNSDLRSRFSFPQEAGDGLPVCFLIC